MAKFAILITALFALFALTGHAETVQLSSYRIPGHDPLQLRLVSRLFELEHRNPDGSFEVQVPAEQAELLRTLAPSAQLVDADVSRTLRLRLAGYALRSARGGYHSFEQVQAWMQAHASNHPDLLHVVDYGVSRAGRKLSALHLSPASSRGRPVVVLTAATHGDELITTEVLLHLVDTLVDGYRRDARLTRLVDNHDLYFIPVVNPDGFVQTNRYDGSADPNRSYPYPGHENVTPTPSIAGVVKFFQGLDVKASIDFHAFGELIMYPWAYTHSTVDPESRARFESLTGNMAAANHYTHGPISDVIYVAPGSSADYYFWKKHSLSLGIEIGNDKVPSPSEFADYFQSQEESTWRFLEGI